MRQLRFAYTFPTGYVQKYPLRETDQGLLLPVLWGFASSATVPTQTEVTAFTEVSQASVAASITYGSSASKHLVILVPQGLGTPTTVSATTVTMVAQSALFTFQNDTYELIFKGYISSGLVASGGTLTVA